MTFIFHTKFSSCIISCSWWFLHNTIHFSPSPASHNPHHPMWRYFPPNFLPPGLCSPLGSGSDKRVTRGGRSQSRDSPVILFPVPEPPARASPASWPPGLRPGENKILMIGQQHSFLKFVLNFYSGWRGLWRDRGREQRVKWYIISRALNWWFQFYFLPDRMTLKDNTSCPKTLPLINT